MGYTSTPEDLAQRQAIIDDIITPQEASLPLRELLIKHVQRLVYENNARLRAKLHYLDTGEVQREDIREFTRFVSHKDRALAERAKCRLAGETLVLRDLSVLSDSELVAAYGDVVLALRERRLPDPLPS